jgi:hypothetical protein
VRGVRGSVRPGSSAAALLVMTIALVNLARASAWETLPAQIEASPTVVVAGASVALAGSIFGSASGVPVTLRITPPAHAGAAVAPVTLQATTTSGGAFAATFHATDAAGSYQVDALGNGLGGISTSFTVASMIDIDAGIRKLLEDLLQAARDVANTSKAKVDELPGSPAKDGLGAQLTTLVQEAGPLAAAIPASSAAAAQIVALSTQAGAGSGDVTQGRDEFAKAVEVARQKVEALLVAQARLSQAQVRCDYLDAMIQSTVLVTAALTAVHGVLTAAAGVALSVQRGSAAAEQHGRLTSAVLEAVQRAYWHVSGEASLLLLYEVHWNDYRIKVLENATAGYCVRFTGDVSAHMQANFVKGSKQWWHYSFALKGTLTVYYPKGAFGDSIPVRGEVYGLGSGFEVAEDAIPVMAPSLASSMVIKKLVLPTGFSASPVGRPFLLRVQGTVDAHAIQLEIGDAIKDFQVKAHVVLFTLSVLPLFPQVISYDLPYADAHLLLSHATAGLVLPVQYQGKLMTAEGNNFVQKTNGEATGLYWVQMALCNPRCGAE